MVRYSCLSHDPQVFSVHLVFFCFSFVVVFGLGIELGGSIAGVFLVGVFLATAIKSPMVLFL